MTSATTNQADSSVTSPSPHDGLGSLRSKLLEAVEAMLKKDSMPSRLSGRVALGVKSKGRCDWLVADFGRQLTTRWSTEYPEFDAALGLDEAGAMELLGGAVPAPGRLCIKTGDMKLLDAFLERYFGEVAAPTLFTLRLRGEL